MLGIKKPNLLLTQKRGFHEIVKSSLFLLNKKSFKKHYLAFTVFGKYDKHTKF
jgi:hypothetical protein